MCGTGCSCGQMFLKVNWIYFVFLDTLHMYDIVIPEMVIFLEANKHFTSRFNNEMFSLALK